MASPWETITVSWNDRAVAAQFVHEALRIPKVPRMSITITEREKFGASCVDTVITAWSDDTEMLRRFSALPNILAAHTPDILSPSGLVRKEGDATE